MRGNIACMAAAAAISISAYAVVSKATGESAPPVPSQTSFIDFPEGTATASEVCGACHQAVYKEHSEGFGSDLHWRDMKNYPASEPAVALLAGVAPGVPRSATAHAAAGTDPWPLDAAQVEEHGAKCNVCHYPQPLEYPAIDAREIGRPKPRAANQAAGLTCASCHLTPDGKIRGPYGVAAPHATIKDDAIRTSAACAFCHSDGQRIVGKQTQTFFEWREDYFGAGLDTQQCQDCHMPKTIRKVAEAFDVPERVAARHLWTGGHSFQRLASALTLAIAQAEQGRAALQFYITNVGAGHSVPTGSNRRAMYLVVQVADANGRLVATKDWMFAPWYAGRPDDKAFLEADKNAEHPFAARQADEQGPHETIIRAGEQRVLNWSPGLPPGRYTVQARLIYDLNRYNDREFKEDQLDMAQGTLEVVVAGQPTDPK
jgi:hypothetical protein